MPAAGECQPSLETRSTSALDHTSSTKEAIHAFYNARHVAVTGAAGTIGRELVQQLLLLGVSGIEALDNDENGLFELDSILGRDPRVAASFCDVAAPDRMRHQFNGVDFVFHAAALKHVPICERTPSAAVDVNINGVANVVEAALACGVKRVVFTSSDKAVHPTNVMGASKLLGERLAVASNKRNGKTVVSCTRFGNVAGSRGSVLHIFSKQIAAGGPISLTSPDMTRFFMTPERAASMVIESMVHAHGGEIFVTKMQTIRVADLATVMIHLLAPVAGRQPEDIQIDCIGPRPGEKFYEELVSDEELGRTVSAGDYLIIQSFPLNYAGEIVMYDRLGPGVRIARTYNSSNEAALTHAEIEAFLRDNGLLPELTRQPLLRLVAAA
jgi:FlaA1/EpsC-like NDP-sugar epimerase